MERQATFLQQWQKLGAERAAGRAAFSELEQLYGEQGRFYHNLEHVERSLYELERSEVEAMDRLLLAMAIWYHDAVYDVRAKDNELQSALLAKGRLLDGGVEGERAAAVYRLIMATCHGVPAAPPAADEALLLDIDLAILGQSEEIYDRYEQAIRLEYSHVELESYRKGRGKVLQSFLNRESIYLTADFRQRYEEPARQNLKRALVLLHQ